MMFAVCVAAFASSIVYCMISNCDCQNLSYQTHSPTRRPRSHTRTHDAFCAQYMYANALEPRESFGKIESFDPSTRVKMQNQNNDRKTAQMATNRKIGQ